MAQHPNAPHPNAPPPAGGGQSRSQQGPSGGGSNAATGHWRQYVTSDTLQAVELRGQPVVVRIERVVRAEMTDRQDTRKQKGVLKVYFRGFAKPLVVKSLLARAISKIVGSTACEKWIGSAVEIYPTTERAFGEVHDVIRISPRRPTPEQARAAGARPPEPEPPPTDMEPDEIREIGAAPAAGDGQLDLPTSSRELRDPLREDGSQ